MDKIYNELIKLANKCNRSDDVPVSAIIVKNGKIISRAYNKREKEYKTINHAEIIAITKANKKLHSCFLYNCDMYVTLKPCEMCQKVINNARINKVFYLIDKDERKKEHGKTSYQHISNECSEKYLNILQEFFNKLRK